MLSASTLKKILVPLFKGRSLHSKLNTGLPLAFRSNVTHRTSAVLRKEDKGAIHRDEGVEVIRKWIK